MPDIRIRREHALGLAKARKIAWAWAEEVEQKFDMECSVLEGETSDTVEFTRTGVSGRLIVAGDHFAELLALEHGRRLDRVPFLRFPLVNYFCLFSCQIITITSLIGRPAGRISSPWVACL